MSDATPQDFPRDSILRCQIVNVKRSSLEGSAKFLAYWCLSLGDCNRARNSLALDPPYDLGHLIGTHRADIAINDSFKGCDRSANFATAARKPDAVYFLYQVLFETQKDLRRDGERFKPNSKAETQLRAHGSGFAQREACPTPPRTEATSVGQRSILANVTAVCTAGEGVPAWMPDLAGLRCWATPHGQVTACCQN